MIKIINQNDELWALNKLRSLVGIETEVLGKQLQISQNKIDAFETRYGKLNRTALYGKVDDMELIEWEGEIETMNRLKKKLASLERISFQNE
jgi:hypothetical protein